MCKALDILGALGRDRLRVMFEVRAKGWVVWWFWRLRGWCEIGKMTYELSDLWEIGYGVSKGRSLGDGHRESYDIGFVGLEKGDFGGRKGTL